MNTLQGNAEKITGRVTPFGMEQVLEDKLKRTIDAYKKFIEDSEKDLKDTEADVEKLKKELEREELKTNSL